MSISAQVSPHVSEDSNHRQRSFEHGGAFSAPVSEALRIAFELSLGRPDAMTCLGGAIADTYSRNSVYFSDETSETAQAIASRPGLHRVMQNTYQANGEIDGIYDLGTAYQGPTPRSDWELIAALETLGHLNVAIARQFLPPELIELAAEWMQSSVEERIRLCERLYDCLTSEVQEIGENVSAAESWKVDYCDQSFSRIFPRLFLKKEQGRPNCFGKAQLLLAFSRMVGAKVVGATPITSGEEYALPSILALQNALATMSAEIGIELPTKLQELFSKRAEAEKLLNTVPSRFHMAVIIELGEGKWYFIDPHMRCRGLVNERLDFGSASRLIEFFCPFLPGYTVLCSQALESQERVEQAMKLGLNALTLQARLLRQWKSRENAASVVVSIVAQDDILRFLLAENIGISPEEKENYLDVLAGKAAFLLKRKEGESERILRFADSSGKEIPFEMLMRLQIALSILENILQEPLILEDGTLQNERLPTAMRKLLGCFFSAAYRSVSKGIVSSMGEPGMIHPMLEIYEPIFRVGVELIAHVNTLTGQRDEVIMSLAAVCGGQLHTLLAGTQAMRTNEAESGLAELARETLQKTPVLLRECRDLLELTERM